MGYPDCNTVAALRAARYDAWQRWWAAPEEKPARRRRERKPTLASVAKQAIKAGIEVARYEVESDGKIVVVTGKQDAGDDAADELSKWRKRRAGHSQGH